MKRRMIKPLLAAFLLLSFFAGNAQHSPDTLRLFLIGNSFSQNAGRYLPQLAAEGNHPLVIGRAEIGGCSLQKHWELAELAGKNPDDPRGRAYKGKSLQMLLSEGKWDVVSLQQNSMNSGDPDTYRPYAQKLHDLIKSIQPGAKVVFHQTWAYRIDSKDFTRLAENQYAQSAEEMWEASRTAYRTVADELDMDLMPVGDAFWKASSDKKWGYKPDKEFDESSAVRPALPEQGNSLHVGYFWKKDSTLGFDSHHANEAGCFLGSLVWYTFLFDESPVKLKFVPEKVPADFAAYLKKTANSVVKR